MISQVSENTLLICVAEDIRDDLPGKLRALCQLMESRRWPWLQDLVPSYTSLLVVYDPDQLDFRQATTAVRQVLEHWQEQSVPGSQDEPSDETRTIELPVYYSEESGPDLAALAKACDLEVDEVISRHTAITCQVYAMGFAPGFAFMGEVDPAIAHPRLDTPRKQVPRGSVGIANRQTAVYPVSSPGGWQLIGRCPTRLFDRNELSLLRIGDKVRFYSISREDYLERGGEL
ncbi:5-oxoprolinase subunit PxpB [Marinobacter halotolerans]|uniref:5-oxoprolinase subunit PxpB n=1 Tax=Marinobacter halotolerans TaxID=1569211 RepID=UPI0012453199|nr:5-oxoprolinase subunit PxpB [Marinobacter halotolerans]